MKIVTYSTNKNSLNESLKRDPQNPPSIDEILKDVSKYLKNDDKLKIFKRYIKIHNLSSDRLLSLFYEDDEEERKIKNKKGKQKVDVHVLKTRSLDRFFDQIRLEKERKENLYQEIKDSLHNIGEDNEVDHIESIIDDELRKEENKEYGEKEFLIKNFFNINDKTEELEIDDNKVDAFLDKYRGDKKRAISKEKIDKISESGRAFLEGLKVDVTIDNYRKIKPDEEEDIKIGKNGGWLYELKSTLYYKDGSEAPYNAGDLFWLGKFNQKINFAFYLLITEFEKNGLLRYKPDEIDKIEDKFSEYPWVEDAKEDIKNRIEKLLNTSNSVYGNDLVEHMVLNNFMKKDDIDKMSQEEFYNKCLDIFANYKVYDSMSRFLKYKKGTDWYSKNQEEYDEYFNGTDWAKVYLTENKGANIDTVIGWYSKANGFENKDFKCGDTNWDLIQMDKDLLKDIDFIE